MATNSAYDSFKMLVDKYWENNSNANFAIVVLHAWTFLEIYMNYLYLNTLGVPTISSNIDKNNCDLLDILENIPFEQKIQFLINNGKLNSNEAKDIRAFQYERNRLFHASHKNNVLSKLLMSSLQKPIVKTAEDAFIAIWNAANRHESTNIELGN